MKRKVFTLIELLSVIAIIAILAALLMPAISSAKAQAKTAMCDGNLKQLSTAVFNYAESYNDYGPDKIEDDGATSYDKSLADFLGTPQTVGATQFHPNQRFTKRFEVLKCSTDGNLFSNSKWYGPGAYGWDERIKSSYSLIFGKGTKSVQPSNTQDWYCATGFYLNTGRLIPAQKMSDCGKYRFSGKTHTPSLQPLGDCSIQFPVNEPYTKKHLTCVPMVCMDGHVANKSMKTCLRLVADSGYQTSSLKRAPIYSGLFRYRNFVFCDIEFPIP